MDTTLSRTPALETVISREVVAAIGAHAAASTPGVVRLEAGVGELLAGLRRSARHRVTGITPAPVTGTSATVSAGLARLRVEIAASGDQPVAVTAAAVQRSVARAVTAATGLLVTGVNVAILDVGPGRGAGGLRQSWRPAEPVAGTGARAPGAPAGEAPPAVTPELPGGSRAQVCAAVVRAVRSVPGLRPASPVRPQRAGWVPWDPAVLAVSLDDGRLQVQLTATRLPLPFLLERAAAAIRAVTARTPWGALPHRLVVTTLDAGAFTAPSEAVHGPPGSE